MIDTLTSAIARIPETFIGNNKKAKLRKSKKTKEISAQLGRGKSAILEAKPKLEKSKLRKSIVKTSKVKPKKAWFQQIRTIYAIDFAIYGNKLHALEVSKCYRHSFDLAKAKITQLEKTQKLKAVVTN